jgi:alpha-N-arabinofuranosidase
MGPEHYAAEFCRYRTYLFEYSGTKPYAVAAGPSSGDWDWTRRFFRYLAKKHWDRVSRGNASAFA